MMRSTIFDGNWSNRLLAAFLTGVFTVLLIIAASLVLRPLFDVPPISVRALSFPYTGKLCPGDSYMAMKEITAQRTVIIFIYISNELPDGSHVIHPLQQPTLVIPHEGAGTFVQPIEWVVPDLPPGTYTRILGVRGHDASQSPLITKHEFTISEDCDRESSLDEEMINAERESAGRDLDSGGSYCGRFSPQIFARSLCCRVGYRGRDDDSQGLELGYIRTQPSARHHRYF